MSEPKPFKPSIAFLRKVESGSVFNAVSYGRRTGRKYRQVGGEKAISAHAAAGLIKAPYVADLGRPSYAELTDAGRKLLSEA